MTRKRKREILKSLFSNYTDKPLSEMNPHEKLTRIYHDIEFQLEIRKRKITDGKGHKEIIIDPNDQANWYFKRFLYRVPK